MNVLIVGLGSIARKHVFALNSIAPTFNVYALRSNISAEIEEGIENIYNLNDVNCVFDFAIISNPTYLHYDYIEILTERGIPLFIEKPAVHKLDNVNILINKIEKKQLITYVACNLRFHPCIEFLRKEICTKKLRINEVNVYCGSFLPEWRVDKNFRSIYSANASMGGGVHLDLFHELDYVTWFFGLPISSNSTLKSISSLNIDSYDYANYTLHYSTFTASVILNYYRRQPKRLIEIVSEYETWTADLLKNEIKNDDGELLFKLPEFESKDTYLRQLEYFIYCLKNKVTPMNSFKESVEILKICLKDEK